jgi:hypothetical protein
MEIIPSPIQELPLIRFREITRLVLVVVATTRLASSAGMWILDLTCVLPNLLAIMI